jgi:hypothetical protein
LKDRTRLCLNAIAAEFLKNKQAELFIVDIAKNFKKSKIMKIN